MKPISIRKARAHLSQLVARVEAGEEFMIEKAGRPVARLVPLALGTTPIRTGGLRIPGGIPADFDRMLSEEIETTFSGPPADTGPRAR